MEVSVQHRKFDNIRDMVNGNVNPGSKAAEAIISAIRTLIDHEICSLDEFLSLIDPKYNKQRDFISEQIAIKAESAIRARTLHPNKIKPWLLCSNYRKRFGQIASEKIWCRLHSAINSIIIHISERFSNN